MNSSKEFLVVVSIVHGRGFPSRSNHLLLAEARFDGEVLSTDPVGHNDEPKFEQELAWELDKSSLQHHRLQRDSIKVIFYALDTDTAVKEAIGYVVLDLRSATNDRTANWYSLLHARYKKHKAQVQLSIYVDGDWTEERTDLTHELEDARPLSTCIFDNESLIPRLHEAEGYYQIGPDIHCRDHFVLSVTIANAGNLHHLLATNQKNVSTNAGFYFTFNLLGNDIQNKPFFDLTQPDFPAERASVKLRSSLDALRAFFQSQSQFYVYLCAGGQSSLGWCVLSLQQLLHEIHGQDLTSPAVFGGWYPLEAPAKISQKLPVYSPDEKPGIGVSVVLRRDCPTEVPTSPHVNTDDRREDHRTCLKNVRIVSPSSPPPVVEDPSPNFVTSTSFPKMIHYFSCSIELCSIRELQTDVQRNLYLRYRYPFFGSSAPISTRPAVTIRKYQEVSLPNGFCAFDFGASPEQLVATFQSVPLVVELLDHEAELNSDSLVGRVTLPLGRLLLKDSSHTRTSRVHGHDGCLRRRLVEKLSVLSVEGNEKFAELSVDLMLEDYGAIESPVDTAVSPTKTHATREEPARARPDKVQCRAALELDLWKEVEEAKFKQELQEKESGHMRALADEWRRRDREREQLCRKKLVEYRALEVQLQAALRDLEKRERVIATTERQLTRRKADLQREHEARVQDLREALRRMKAEAEHRVQVECAATQEAELESTKVVERALEAEQKLKEAESRFAQYRAAESCRPEVQLQAEISLVVSERQDLQRRLDDVLKSKLHYKSSWARALKELVHTQEREQKTARDLLSRQQAELEHMRLRFVAQEQREQVTPTTHAAADDMTAERLPQGPPPELNLIQPGASELALNETAARLVEERDTLLRTGVYEPSDPIIQELERQIRDSCSRTADKKRGPGSVGGMPNDVQNNSY